MYDYTAAMQTGRTTSLPAGLSSTGSSRPRRSISRPLWKIFLSGIVAVTFVFAAFFSLFADMGIGSAIIQNKDLDDADIASIFSFTARLSVVLGVAFVFFSFPMAWFYKGSIQYDKLYMMNVGSAEECRKLGNHAEFKASIYKQRKDMVFFVESELHPAEIICRISRKAVFCPTNHVFYEESMLTTVSAKAKSNIKSFLYPFIPKLLLKLYRKLKYGRNLH